MPKGLLLQQNGIFRKRAAEIRQFWTNSLILFHFFFAHTVDLVANKKILVMFENWRLLEGASKLTLRNRPYHYKGRKLGTPLGISSKQRGGVKKKSFVEEEKKNTTA